MVVLWVSNYNPMELNAVSFYYTIFLHVTLDVGVVFSVPTVNETIVVRAYACMGECTYNVRII